MSKKPFCFALCAMLFVLCFPAEAQQAKKIPRIGYLSRGYKPTATAPDLKAEAFRQGLRELGYIEGKNIVMDFRYAEGKGSRFSNILADLIKLNVKVLVSGTPQAIRPAKKATKTIPIVIIVQGDPVTSGLVDSLARPGGNVTGLTRFTRRLHGKRLELLKEAVPGISRVIHVQDAGQRSRARTIKQYSAAARALKIELQALIVRDPKRDLEAPFQAAATSRTNALLMASSPTLYRSRKWIANLATENRLPSMNEDGRWVEAGGLLSYSANNTEHFRRAATYVDKILKGAKPGDLPIEQPRKFELLINLKTAKQLGITISPEVLFQATKVIK